MTHQAYARPVLAPAQTNRQTLDGVTPVQGDIENCHSYLRHQSSHQKREEIPSHSSCALDLPEVTRFGQSPVADQRRAGEVEK
jgi:hypothetical protein